MSRCLFCFSIVAEFVGSNTSSPTRPKLENNDRCYGNEYIMTNALNEGSEWGAGTNATWPSMRVTTFKPRQTITGDLIQILKSEKVNRAIYHMNSIWSKTLPIPASPPPTWGLISTVEGSDSHLTLLGIRDILVRIRTSDYQVPMRIGRPKNI